MRSTVKSAKNKKVVIGLTGGIASGKSTALKAFKRLGASTISSDDLSRRITQKGRKELQQIVRLFGSSVLTVDGNLDRQALAEIVFNNLAARKKLEKILHPAIARERKKLIAQSQSQLIVCEVPLLFEARLSKNFDATVLVWVPQSLQLARLKKRDALSLRQARARIQTQLPLNQKKKLADFVLDNSGSPAFLKRQVQRLWVGVKP